MKNLFKKRNVKPISVDKFILKEQPQNNGEDSDEYKIQDDDDSEVVSLVNSDEDS